MFRIEYQRRRGANIYGTCLEANVEEVLAVARKRAVELGAEYIRIVDGDGRHLGIFPVEPISEHEAE
jgi:hypothetical protein